MILMGIQVQKPLSQPIAAWEFLKKPRARDMSTESRGPEDSFRASSVLHFPLLRKPCMRRPGYLWVVDRISGFGGGRGRIGLSQGA